MYLVVGAGILFNIALGRGDMVDDDSIERGDQFGSGSVHYNQIWSYPPFFVA